MIRPSHKKLLLAIAGFAFLGLSISSGIGLKKLSFNDDYESSLESSSPLYQTYESFVERFGSDSNQLTLVIQADDVYEIEFLHSLYDLHYDLAVRPQVSDVVSIYSLRGKESVGRNLLPLLRGPPDATNIDAAQQSIRNHPLGSGILVSTDGTAVLVQVQLDEDVNDVSAIESFLQDVHGCLDKHVGQNASWYGVTGIPPIRAAIVSNVRTEQVKFALLGGLVASLVAWLCIRRPLDLIVAVLGPAIGTLWTLGILGVIGQEINVISCVIPAIVFVIGLADSLHMVHDFQDHRQAGKSAMLAIKLAVRQTGPACFLTTLTTAIGFSSLAICDDHTIRQFGLATAMGTGLVLLAVMTVMPATIYLLSLTRFVYQDLSIQPSDGKKKTLLFGSLGNLVIKYNRWLMAISMILVVVCVLQIPKLQSDFRFTENLREESEIRQATSILDKSFGGSSAFAIVAEWESGETPSWKDVANMLGEVNESVSENHQFGAVISYLNVIESMPGDTLEARAARLRDLPVEVRNSFVSFQHRQLPIRVMIPDSGSRILAAEFETLRENLETVAAQTGNQFSFEVTGLPVVSTYQSNQTILDLTRSLVFASLVIFFVITVFFRSWKMGLISVLPNALPLLACAALLHWIGLPVQYTSVMVFSVCLGIAADDTIHMVTRFQREKANGMSTDDAIRQSIQSTGWVLCVTTALMIVGFGVGVLSVFPPLVLFASLSCFCLVAALIADLILLPAIISVTC